MCEVIFDFPNKQTKNRIEKQTECYQKKFSIDLMGCEKNKYLDIDSINKINTKKKQEYIPSQNKLLTKIERNFSRGT
jgi:hypothetical protein